MNIPILEHTQILTQVLAGTSVGIAAAYIGSLMVMKKMALAGDALSHLALPGVALALAWHFDISIGASLSLSSGALILWYLALKTELALESLTAVLFASVLALTLIYVPMEQLEIALIGNLDTITIWQTLVITLISLFLFSMIHFLFKPLILSNFNRDLAQAEGIPVKRNDLLYLLCVAGTVSLGVKVVGSFLLAALVAIPAATSRIIARTLFEYRMFSIVFGCLSSILGIISAEYMQIPRGPCIIVINTLFFILSLALLSFRCRR